jgi:hypothetical protein
VRISEDKVRTKDSCWSVGTIYDPRELPGVSIIGPGIGRGVTARHAPRATTRARAWVLGRHYRDESMIDSLSYYGGMYLYRLGGGWLHDRFNLVLICYNHILYIRNSNKLETKYVT